MADIECEHCGGTNFYKESGYYFCKTCQIQSQEVREYAFEEFGLENVRTQTKKITNEKSAKNDNKITSWECCNYVLLGLTQELISLGAAPDLKEVVKFLWLRYLEKLGVFKAGKSQLPKLQAVCSDIDAEIVYGRMKPKKKRKRASSSETNSTTLRSVSTRQEKKKRRQALVKAQYEEFSQKSQGTPSLHNETLTSLQTGSEKSSKSTKVSYNFQATRELRRLYKTGYHNRKHKQDLEENLHCHKPTYRQISARYRKSPYLLSLNKLYSILYLALLITKDKIQLSDLLRFIKEGKLTFNCYSHFFPEEFFDKTLNFRNFFKHSVFSNGQMRLITSEMSIFLETDFYVSCPNLVELCERYCCELNLPKSVSNCVLNIFSKTNMSMSFRKRFKRIPNYEGRVLSVILFVLKLLFGLDGLTELRLGEYAAILNNSQSVKSRMFNVVDWLKFLEYRELVMSEGYFPVSFTKSARPSSALCYLSAKQYPSEPKFHQAKDKFKQFLQKLKDGADEPEGEIFQPTLTPFRDYLKLLKQPHFLDVASEDFSRDHLEHILQPSQFVEALNAEFVHGGANDLSVEKVKIVDSGVKTLQKRRKLLTVKFTLNLTVGKNQEVEATQLDPEAFKDNFQSANEANFEKNLKQLSSLEAIEDVDFVKLRKELKKVNYEKHYNSFEGFWLRVQDKISLLSHKDCRKFVKKFPNHFQIVFRECLRIAEQTEQEFLIEYQLTELYLVYLANYSKKDCKELRDKFLLNCLNKSEALW